MRGLGLIPDYAADVKEDLLHRHISNLVGAPIEAPATVRLDPFVDEVPNQKGTSECGPFALCTVTTVRAAVMGHPLPERPSEPAVYAPARFIDQPGGPLLDVGVRLRALLEAAQRYGLVASSRWPFDEATVNDPPPLDVYEAGALATLDGWYRVGHTQRSDDVVLALAKGHPLIYGQQVDDAYERLEAGDTYDGLQGPSRGGHAQGIVGYETLPDGTKRFRIVGSWGRDFADHGFTWVTERFLNSDDVFDVMAVSIVPKVIT